LQVTLDPIVEIPLLRAFTQPGYLTEFLGGAVRLTQVSEYRDMECPNRLDRDEGEARHTVLGVEDTPVHYGGAWHNPIYVLCFSHPDVDRAHLVEQYGRHVIQLTDVPGFVSDLASAMKGQCPEGREVSEIQLAPVRYNRDLVLDPEPSRVERHRLMWAQKGVEFAADQEVRLALFLSGPVKGAPKTWTVQSKPPATLEPAFAT